MHPGPPGVAEPGTPTPPADVPAAGAAGASVAAPAGLVAAAPAGLARTRGRRGRRPLLVALSGVALLALWWWGAGFFEDYILPPPQDVWASLRDTMERGVWREEVLATLGHALVAFGLILAIGLPLGIVIGRVWFVEDLARLPLTFLQTIPTVVLIALALIFIGTTPTGVVAVTVASGLTYFTLNVIQGTKSIDRDLVEMGRAYGAGEASLMRSIVLPSVVPYFLAGARVTLGVVWQVTLFGEYLMGTPGVGFQINSSIKLLDTSAVFAWGLSIVALTLLVEFGIFRPAEAYLTRHTRRS